MAGDLVKQFCEEAMDHLRSFATHVLAIERNQETDQHFSELLRQLHSMKGSSRMLGLTAFSEALHTTEDLISALSNKPYEIVTESINPLLKVSDALQDALVDIHLGETVDQLDAVGEMLSDLRERLAQDNSETLSMLASNESEVFSVLNRQQKEMLTVGLRQYSSIHIITLSFHRSSFAADVRKAHDILNANGMLVSTTGTTHPPVAGYDLSFIFLVLSNHTISVITGLMAEHSPEWRTLVRGPEAGAMRYLTELAPPASAEAVMGETDNADIVVSSGTEGTPPVMEGSTKPPADTETEEEEHDPYRDEEFLRLQQWFLDEARESLKELYDSILSFEKLQSPDILNSIFRTFHNLKGSGGSYRFECVSRVAHAMESYVHTIRSQGKPAGTEAINAMLRGVDVLEEMFAACKNNRQDDPQLLVLEEDLKTRLLPSAEPTVAPASASTAAPGPVRPQKTLTTETLRIERSKLDAIVNSAVELSIAHHTEQHVMDSLSSASMQQQLVLQQWQSLHGALASYAGTNEVLQQLIADFSGLLTASHHQLRDLGRVVEANLFTWNKLAFLLRSDVLHLHLQPLSQLFESSDRIARDLMLTLQKTVQIEIEGGEIEVDRRIIEAMRDPMVHLLRNAIDHGIESPDQRERAGKPVQGAIRISARQMGFIFAIEVSDDGGGIDHDAVAAKAMEHGLVTADELAIMSETERCALLFRHGFSTRKTVNTISGRGVGLDVVATNVQRLGGSVAVHSTAGHGTRFEITLPTTLTSTRVVVLEIDGRSYSIPVAHVEQIVLLQSDSVQTSAGKRFLSYRDSLLPVLDLEDVLQAPHSTRRHRKGLIIRTTGMSLCLSVPVIVDELELITRPLPPFCKSHQLFSGANILPDGSISLLISPHLIAGFSARIARVAPLTARKRPHVLVVDDSLIARELLKNILIGTGYEVSLARDGQDGLLFLRTNSVDLVLSDIDMPIMDGLSLLRAMKREPLFSNIPVVMFTSQEQEARREECRVAGASAYITKGAFHQNNLLATIDRILSGVET
jgi:two-component system, chemotaxis family, sensor kinase CheA